MKRFLLICLLANVVSNSLFAWGHEGHEMVADIAYQLLAPATQQKVKHYLGKMSIEQAGTWMDEIKGDRANDYMKPWHYINIEKGQEYKPSDTANIIWALNATSNELKSYGSMPDEKVKRDICILFHLMGDLGQPLHSGYGSDKGGNTVDAFTMAKTTNLHAVWDSEIIHDQRISLEDCKAYYNKLKPDAIAKIKQGSFVDWMNESRAYLSEIYNFKHHEIGQAYESKYAVVIKKQIVYSGIRLAAILESIFKS